VRPRPNKFQTNFNNQNYYQSSTTNHNQSHGNLLKGIVILLVMAQSVVENPVRAYTAISVNFGHSEKAAKISNNPPLDLTFTKGTSNHVGDCFKFCGLLRKPEL
jgi:hypothetical protein